MSNITHQTPLLDNFATNLIAGFIAYNILQKTSDEHRIIDKKDLLHNAISNLRERILLMWKIPNIEVLKTFIITLPRALAACYNLQAMYQCAKRHSNITYYVLN